MSTRTDFGVGEQRHFVSPETKLTAEWMRQMVQSFYHYNKMCLLEGKDQISINAYAAGSQPMEDYRKLISPGKRKVGVNYDDNPDNHKEYVEAIQEEDISGIDFEPIGILVQPLNSAIATLLKQELDISVTAVDPAAAEKRKQDFTLLKNAQRYKKDLEEIGVKGRLDFNLGPVNNSLPVEDYFGLDPNDDGDLQLIKQLFYKLKVEASFETLLYIYQDIKKIPQTREEVLMDVFKWGVLSMRSFLNTTTQMPDLHWRFPGNIYVDRSCRLNDYSDSTFIFEENDATLEELFAMFGDEIKTDEDLNKIATAYSNANDSSVKYSESSSERMQYSVKLVYIEFKSIDHVNYRRFRSKTGRPVFKMESEPSGSDSKQMWAENTYCCYWIPGTEYIFKPQRLTGFERKPGMEYYSGYSFVLYRAQRKSAVELCISHVKAAQRAYIKLQHAIIKAKPNGQYINLRFLREAADNLADFGFTHKSLLDLFFVNNIMIGDTTGLGNTEASQQPFIQIPGGVGKEIDGYWKAMEMAAASISRLTGINDQLTGQSETKEGLVGVQKLMINASINSIHYASIAQKFWLNSVMRHWAYLFTEGMKKSAYVRDAVERMVGAHKAEAVEGLKDCSLHRCGVVVDALPMEQLRLKMDEIIAAAFQAKAITPAEVSILERIVNPKDQQALLLLLEKRKQKADMQRMQMEQQARMQEMQQQMQGAAQIKQMQVAADVQKIQAQGEVDAGLMEIAHKLGLEKDYVQNNLKSQLQRERNVAQYQKAALQKGV